MIRRDYRYGDDESQRRTEISVDGLIKAECAGGWAGETPLRAALDHWKSRMTKGCVREKELDVAAFQGLSHFMVDVRAENPNHYRYIIFTASGGNLRRYKDHISSLHGTVIAQHPIAAMRDDMMREYLLCKAGAQPTAHRLTHTLGGLTRDYARLLLPVCDRSGNVVSLIGVARHLEAPAESPKATRPG